MTKIQFKFGPGNVPKGKETVFARRVKTSLEKTPLGYMYNNYELGTLVGYSGSHVQSEGNISGLEDFRVSIEVESQTTGKHTYKIFWGSKKTIAAYRKEIKNADNT